MSTPSDKIVNRYNKSFCIKPFTEISNSAIGERMLCCRSEPVGIKIKNPDITEDFFNNPAMHEIRRKMLVGEEVKECWICKESEMASGKSHRTFIMEDTDRNVVDEIFETGKVELRSLDIRFGTKCNLACVMCGPGSSSLIAKEEDDEIGLIDLNDFSLDQIKKHSNGIVLFKTTGGEPMLLPAYKKTLEFFVEKDLAKNIEFTTITNGTVDYSDLLPLMNEFKLFKISHSIDAVDESYNYVRWPGKMSRIKRIHKRIVENAKQYKNIKLEWGATIHVLNVNQVVKISKYLQTLGMHNAYNIDMVHEPEFMQPGLVPKQVLDELEVEALQWQDWQPGEYRQEILDFIETLKYNYTKINKDPNNKKVLLNELEVKTIFWKAKRNLDVRDYVPYYKALKTK